MHGAPESHYNIIMESLSGTLMYSIMGSHSGTLMHSIMGSHSGTLMNGTMGSHSGTLMYSSWLRLYKIFQQGVPPVLNLRMICYLLSNCNLYTSIITYQ